MNSRRVFIVDSLRFNVVQGTLRERITKTWLDYITDVNDDVNKKPASAIECNMLLEDWLRPLESIKVSTQTNGYDCGVYVLMYIFHLALQKQAVFSPEEVTALRDKMIFLLVTNFENYKQDS